jgi:hypothetical protein
MQKLPSKKNDKNANKVSSNSSSGEPINPTHDGSGEGHIKTQKSKESGKVKK